MTEDNGHPGPGIVEVYVDGYKGLSRTRVRWADHMVLFGPNGSGKSNLLEAVSILFGTEDSVELLGTKVLKSATNEATRIEAVVVGDLLTDPGPAAPARLLGEGGDRLAAVARDYSRIATWWQAHDPDWEGTLGEWIAAKDLAEEVREVISDALAKRAVRYELCDSETTSDGRFARTYKRTLMVPAASTQALRESKLPEWLSLVNEKSARESGWWPLLRLPDASLAPIAVQYLPRPRSAQEQTDQLDDAVRTATQPVAQMLDDLGGSIIAELIQGDAPESNEAEWWVNNVGARAAHEELIACVPGLSVEAGALYYGGADLQIVTKAENGRRVVDYGGTDPDEPTGALSRSQARWADEAFAVAAEAMRAFGREATQWSTALSWLDESEVLEALHDRAAIIESNLNTNEYWAVDDLEKVRTAIGPLIERSLGGRLARVPNRAQDVAAEYWGMSRRTAPRLLRFIDEPEAFLDSKGRARITRRFQSMRYQGQSVVVASHQPDFIDMTGYQLLLFSASNSKGRLTTRLNVSERRDLAREMGFGQGELLTGARSILLVEGAHDKMVLQRYADLGQFGCLILRLHGIDQADFMHTASLDFVDEYLDVPIALLLDHTRLSNVQATTAPARLTKEERALRHVRAHAATQHRMFKAFGLKEADIVCYLSETLMRERSDGRFTTWRKANNDFQSDTPKDFKRWCQDRYGVDVVTTDGLAALVAEMKVRSLPTEGDLQTVIDQIQTWAANPTGVASDQ